MKKDQYFVLILFLVLFVFIFFNYGFNKSKNRLKFKAIPNNIYYNQELKQVTYNKIIIVGDSRMEYIYDRGKNIKIPVNFNFIALGGTKINWFQSIALKELENKLDNMNDKYKYHVLINMGVNDLNDNLTFEKHADDYFYLINRLVLKYRNVNFYILSVNPINENKINNYFKPQYRTSAKIEGFNSEITKMIENKHYKNLYYCDSYNSITFNTPDGLHYNKDTDQKIVNYIVDDCIKYKKEV